MKEKTREINEIGRIVLFLNLEYVECEDSGQL